MITLLSSRYAYCFFSKSKAYMHFGTISCVTNINIRNRSTCSKLIMSWWSGYKSSFTEYFLLSFVMPTTPCPSPDILINCYQSPPRNPNHTYGGVSKGSSQRPSVWPGLALPPPPLHDLRRPLVRASSARRRYSPNPSLHLLSAVEKNEFRSRDAWPIRDRSDTNWTHPLIVCWCTRCRFASWKKVTSLSLGPSVWLCGLGDRFLMLYNVSNYNDYGTVLPSYSQVSFFL